MIPFHKKRSLLHLTLLLFCITAIGQTNATDTELWTSVGLEYEASKAWSFEIEEALRLKDNIGAIDQYFTQVTASYKLFKGTRIGLGGRYSRSNDNSGAVQGYENRFRFNVDASYKYDVNRFTLRHRLRYQNRNELGVSSADGDIARQRFRFKTSLGYNIRKWKLDPKISGEVFNSFATGQQSSFNRYRLVLETAYKFKNAGRNAKETRCIRISFF